MFTRRRLTRLFAAGPIGALLAIGLSVVPANQVRADVVVHTRAGEVSGPLDRVQVRSLPFPAHHVALYWAGNPDATVTVAFSTDGVTFGAPMDAARDEVGEQLGNGQTYGVIMPAGGAIAAQVSTDRPLGRITVLALAEGATTVHHVSVPARPAGAAVPQPIVIPRSGWNANESLRFDAQNKEVWPPVFQTVQKVVVHHTAGVNNDPDPVSTIQSIYYYHAITQGWGDIGYNFLIDEAGHIYKGRNSHLPTDSTQTGDTLDGENGSPSQSVTAGHAYGYNSGTIGVALLGTLTNQDATPLAKSALEDVLAWKAGAHGMDPKGSSVYTNPINGTKNTFPNIVGHRDVPNNSTECPGGVFYSTLGDVRNQVVSRLAANAAGPPDTTAPPATAGLTAASGSRQVTLSWQPSIDTGGSGVAGYEVYRSSTAGGKPALLGVTTSPNYTDAGLARRTYWYSVKAFDGAGNRSASSSLVPGTPT